MSDIIERIEARFGKMEVARSKKHKFLGMEIDFIGNKKVIILMQGHLEDAILSFGEKVTKTYKTPAANVFFTVDEDSPRLSENDSATFISVVYKLAYSSMRARGDLVRTAHGFLMTRVSCPTAQDWQKLKARSVSLKIQSTISSFWAPTISIRLPHGLTSRSPYMRI